MSKEIAEITPELADWIAQQKVFFVATAPLSANGHVNCSPKGGDSFRVLGPRLAAYQDYTGSGAETSAHLKENGRIVIMFCAFDGEPRISRLHGRGEILRPGMPDYPALAAKFPENPGTRAIVRVTVTRISTSCGFAVPFFDFQKPRDTLDKYAVNKGPEGLVEYRKKKNARSIDGLPGAFET
jgi:hypothetical protein